MVKDLKKELSKLSGVDFFNPKYRDVFKKYFPDEEDAKSEGVVEDVDVVEKEVEAPVVEDIKETEEVVDENVSHETTEDEVVEEVVEDAVEDVVDNNEEIVEDANNQPETLEETAVENVESVETDDNVRAELLDAKIELELIKSGVKPERLSSAKKYAKYEITSLDELDKIQDMLSEYPEWVAGEKAENFGMPVDENSDNLTEEEKRLKEMGIDPKN